jgi:hypothetical protein
MYVPRQDFSQSDPKLCNQGAKVSNLHIARGNPKKNIIGGNAKLAYFAGVKAY